MKKFIEVSANTVVDAYSVTALQGRFVNSTDQYGDTAKGTITISTIGGSLIVQSNNMAVDLVKLRELVESTAVPMVFSSPVTTTNVVNGTGTPSSSHE